MIKRLRQERGKKLAVGYKKTNGQNVGDYLKKTTSVFNASTGFFVFREVETGEILRG